MTCATFDKINHSFVGKWLKVVGSNGVEWYYHDITSLIVRSFLVVRSIKDKHPATVELQ